LALWKAVDRNQILQGRWREQRWDQSSSTVCINCRFASWLYMLSTLLFTKFVLLYSKTIYCCNSEDSILFIQYVCGQQFKRVQQLIAV